MRQNQTITTLIEDCIGYFEQNCYTRHRIERYKSMWRNGLCRYMSDRGITSYDFSVGEKFIQNNISSEVTPTERDIIRSVSVLNDMLTTGSVSKMTAPPVTRELTGSIGEAIASFLARLKELRRSQSTIHGYLLYLHRFLQYLENNRISLPEQINEHHILTFISTQTNSKISIVSSLRVFFRHLLEERIIKTDYSYILATRLGLRASDIAGLTFANVDTSGVSIGQRRQGPHSMRHSLASRLLENSVSLPVISESLGHRSTETTMTYLRIDIKAMRGCALDVPTVAEEFYNQRNGAFYE